MNAAWLTGLLALLGAAIGAAAPSLLNRRFQKDDKKREALAELNQLFSGWEAPYARAAAILTMGVLDPKKAGEHAQQISDIDLHSASSKLAQARFIAAERAPELLAMIDDVEILDQRLMRTYAERIVEDITLKDAVLRMAEIQQVRLDRIKSIRSQIHGLVGPHKR
jgi:hypothetical protein